MLRETKQIDESNHTSTNIVSNSKENRVADLKYSRHGDYGRAEKEGEEEEPIPNGASGLTLLRMKTWMQEPIDRYCHMK